jgi:hypothetical protein
MSKLKYTSSYDNNPNSDFGASKTVAKEYKKLLAKEKLQPIMQEMNNQTKSVVTNLNDYSLLLKTITQNLVNAELYLSNPEVSRSKGRGRYTEGGPKTKDTGTKAKTNKDSALKIVFLEAKPIKYFCATASVNCNDLYSKRIVTKS